MLLQLHIGDSVHQKSANPVRTLIHRYAVASFIQLIGNSKSGRAASYNCYRLSCPDLGRLRIGIALFIGILNNRIFIFLRGNRIPDQIAGAGCFTERRAHTGGKLRKAVRLFQTVIGLLPVSGIN